MQSCSFLIRNSFQIKCCGYKLCLSLCHVSLYLSVPLPCLSTSVCLAVSFSYIPVPLFIYPSSLVHISQFPCSYLSIPLFISLCSLVHLSLFSCSYFSVPLFISLCSLVRISLFSCSYLSVPLFTYLSSLVQTTSYLSVPLSLTLVSQSLCVSHSWSL